ncbi:hypothetical protein CBR_g5756 [Chara braunii]|uniref:Zinc finger CHCC-type domain-containing protein n=1 Tax=Chara braunii TaxID=69332 RepID=A0A388KJC4_CHABU|nr:hypothetical protein CBR_g5756 [Chara braunii]|eukprot:GBG70126.1 hypothetical protein CBR_g5756 [Chara braunii]
MSRAAVTKLRGVVSRILAAPRGSVTVSPPVPFPQLSAASGVSSSGSGARVSASASGCHARALSTAAFSGRSFWTAGGCRLAAVVADNSSTSDESNHIEREMTGLEREELEGELTGKKRFDLEPPRGPFGTKEAPAIIESKFEWRIVGCSGGVGEEEHDVVWFELKKGQNYECPVCSQVFQLKTIPDAAGGH